MPVNPNGGVRLTNCFASLCDQPEPISGFALIKLVNPLGDDVAVCNTITGEYLVCGEVIQVEIDPVTGCWLSCELPCNSDLSPAGTYYEIQEFINNKCCGTHIVQLDCDKVDYPDPTPVKEVSITNPGPPPKSLLCPIVKCCETPFLAMSGCGIDVVPGDHPDGEPGNGHSPTISVSVSQDPNNVLECLADGLFVPVPEFGLKVTTGNCLDHDVSGSGTIQDPFCLDLNLNIDPDPDNAAFCGPNGLYVKSTVVEGGNTPCITTVVNGSGTNSDPYVVTAEPVISILADNVLSCEPSGLYVQDTNNFAASGDNCITLDHSGDGTIGAPHTFEASINIDPKGNNLTECGPDGICTTVVVDGPCLDGAGTVGNPISVVVSADPVNLIECAADGLHACIFVDPPCLAGAGTQTDPLTLVIDPKADNLLTCGPNGLCVVDPGCTCEIQDLDTPTVDTTITGTGNAGDPYIVSSVVLLSGDAGNIITYGSDGALYVPEWTCDELNNCVLTDLSDVTCANPATGDVLTWNGTDWTCEPLPPESILVVTTDGDTVGVAQSGTNDHTVDIIVTDPDSGNLLTVGPNGGSFLDCAAIDGCLPQLILTTDGNPVGVTPNPADPWDIDITLWSTDPGNILQIGSDGGLYWDCDALNTCPVSSLVDVNDGGRTVGDIFVWNGTNWVPVDLCTHLDTVSIECLGDVDWQPTPPAAGEYLCFDGTNWTNQLVEIYAADGTCTEVSGLGTAAAPLVFDVVVDPAAANMLTCGPSGLFVSMADGTETDVAAGDCITVTGVGSALDPYVVSTAISGAAGNALVCNPDGLFISPAAFTCDDLDSCDIEDLGNVVCAAASDGDVLTWNAALGIWTCEPPAPPDPFECSDLNTCQLTDIGDVTCVAPGLNDVLTWNGTDWTCAPIPPFSLNTANTDCIVLTGDGSTGSPLTATAVVDPDGAIVCGPDGLQAQVGGDITIVNNEIFVDVCASLGNCSISELSDVDCNGPNDGDVLVWSAAAQEFNCAPPPFNIEGSTGDCINVTVTGSGSTADPYVVAAVPVIDPAVDNGLVCTNAGLYIPVCPDPVVTTNGTALGVTQSGDCSSVIDITVVSGDADNEITIGSDGGAYFNLCAAIKNVPQATGPATPQGTGIELFGVNVVTGECERYFPTPNCERVSWGMVEYCDDPECLPCEPIFSNSFITDVAICAATPADADQTFDVQLNGTTIDQITLPAGGTSVFQPGPGTPLSAGSSLNLVPVSPTPSTPSTCITVALRLCDR